MSERAQVWLIVLYVYSRNEWHEQWLYIISVRRPKPLNSQLKKRLQKEQRYITYSLSAAGLLIVFCSSRRDFQHSPAEEQQTIRTEPERKEEEEGGGELYLGERWRAFLLWLRTIRVHRKSWIRSVSVGYLLSSCWTRKQAKAIFTSAITSSWWKGLL